MTIKQNFSNNWQKVRLGEICKIVSGSTPKTSDSSYWNGEIGWVTPYDLSKLKDKYISNGNRNITELGLKNCSAELLPVNSLIMSSRAPIGYFAINKKPVATNQGCKSFVCDNSIDTEFLYYSLNQVIDSIKKVGSGSTFAEVGKSNLEKISILVPEKNVQQKIALILSTVDEEIQKTDQIIEKTEKLKSGLMNKLLTKGIGHTKFKKTKIGEIPEDWKINRIEEVCEKVNVGFVGTCERYYTDNNGVPMIRTGNIKNGKLDLTEIKYVTEEFNNKNKKSQIFPDDILIARHGEIGQATLVPNNLLLANCLNVVIVRSNRNFIFPKFLTYVINSSIVKKQIKDKSAGSTQSVINTGEIANCLILLPTLDEQNKIVKILDEIVNKIKIENEYKEKLTQTKNGLMNDIFSQKVEVLS